MNKVHTLIFLSVLISLSQSINYKECITTSFNSTCKNQLYNCFNDSDCSYQLHENTKHIFLTPSTESVPSIFFSNSLAVELHKCLNQACSIGPIDSNYPKTLSSDYCIMEVWDICGGDVE